MKKHKSTLIVDMDNTLFDWVDLWHATFTAMMSEVERRTGLSLHTLEAEIRTIFQKHRTSEYSFLLSDLSSLEPFRNGQPASIVFSDAIRAFRDARRKHLHLYPTVGETLLLIKGAGCRIAAYTESLKYYSFYRVKRLGLDGVIDILYSPDDHEVPEDVGRFYQEDFYRFKYTQHHFTPAGELKPNPHILETIIRDSGAKPEEVVYVGDSLHKDIAMANALGIDNAWAKYGEAQDRDAYELLKRVTHWSDEDVSREAEIRKRPGVAGVVLTQYFSELLAHFNFAESYQPTGNSP